MTAECFCSCHFVLKVSSIKRNTRVNRNDEIYGLKSIRREKANVHLMSSHNIDGIVTWHDIP